ncbi:MAG: GIY-YIG nuclease family protein [Bacteroidota bacterium]|nr:GIY-YIG nuclease family protein [Bacteroidota bacterium]
MFYAYVIKSVSFNYFYKGHCEDLKMGLKQHNSGMTASTKPYIPFEIVYFEEFAIREEAIKREKYFKSAAGRKFLKPKMTSGFNL